MTKIIFHVELLLKDFWGKNLSSNIYFDVFIMD